MISEGDKMQGLQSEELDRQAHRFTLQSHYQSMYAISCSTMPGAAFMGDAQYLCCRLMFFEQAREQEEAKWRSNKQDSVVRLGPSTSAVLVSLSDLYSLTPVS